MWVLRSAVAAPPTNEQSRCRNAQAGLELTTAAEGNGWLCLSLLCRRVSSRLIMSSSNGRCLCRGICGRCFLEAMVKPAHPAIANSRRDDIRRLAGSA